MKKIAVLTIITVMCIIPNRRPQIFVWVLGTYSISLHFTVFYNLNFKNEWTNNIAGIYFDVIKSQKFWCV